MAADITQESAGHLRQRPFLYLASALLVLMLGLMGAISLTLLDQLKRAKNDNLAHIDEVRSMIVTEWCRRAKDLARQITSRTMIRRALEKYNQGKISMPELTRKRNRRTEKSGERKGGDHRRASKGHARDKKAQRSASDLFALQENSRRQRLLEPDRDLHSAALRRDLQSRYLPGVPQEILSGVQDFG